MPERVHTLLKTLYFLFLFFTFLPSAQANSVEKGVLPAVTAEYIHSIIEANRTIYTEVIVERLGAAIALPATENWEKDNALMLPAQFLLASSQHANSKNIGMTYRLLSLWPINPKNGPKTDFETNGLKQVALKPETPFAQVITMEGKSFFQVIYPDKGVSKACVNCHNQHSKSPRTDFNLGDVMGGIIINLPISKPDASSLIPPEVVADYIHSILESARAVYATYIVDRLQQKKIAFASEQWWEDNTLLLPAQFLLDSSDLIAHKKLPLDFNLISQWPINPAHGPANEFERTGLKYVNQNKVRPFIGKTQVGTQDFFKVVYPDFAVAPSCVDCHNKHPNSPRNDFKLGDVMGGISLSFPVQTGE
ncbi:MAG: DUF3365 domain-containing protein [Candidatus Nitrohelix vancouverensis]|uniref:DUF3365 domain-containing protein n=1 Tax=Candidatus Nitrohelix vancouverensis TaxID=2705534 RepID=A0A7T0C4K3_9BACT|nr:MAG: DUF3365 domain-containing protein [Candidatus Nitrohelix vancouverensis]